MKHLIFVITLQYFFIIFSLAIASSSAAAEEAATEAVVHHINAKSYQSSVLDSSDHWLVVYCGTDQNLDSFLENVSKKFSNYGISVGKIDCSKEIKRCQTDGVTTIPSLRFFNGRSVLNPYSGKHMKSSEMFSGETLNIDSVMKFISSGLPSSLVTQVSSGQELDAFIGSNTDLPTAILFSDKAAVSLVLRSIAGLFKGRIRFLFVSIKSAPEIAGRFNIGKTTIGIFGINSAELTVFNGEDVSSRSAIAAWLNTFSPEIPPVVPPTASTTKEDSAHQNEHFSDAFKIDTLPMDGAWIVGVLDEGVDIPKEWTLAKKGCAGYIRSAILRCRKGDQLTSVDIDGKGDSSGDTAASTFGQQVCRHVSPSVPSLLTIRYGEGERNKFLTSKFAWDSVLTDFSSYDKVLKKLGESLPASSVENIYEEMLPQYVTQGYEKGMITILLLSDGPAAPALFKNVAMGSKGLMQFGFISGPSVKLVKSANNMKLPGVIALLPALPDTAAPAEGMAMRIVNYDHKALGPVRYDSLSMFIVALLRDAGVDQLRRDAIKEVKEEVIESSQSEVITISQEEEWTTHCGEAFRGICAIGLLTSSSEPNILNGMDVMIAAMKAMKKVGASFRFLAIDAACHSEFALTFGINAHELPTVVIYSPSKRRYQILKGSFTEASIVELAQSILSGRSSTVPLSSRPVVSAQCDASSLDNTGANDFIDTAESSEDAEEFLKEIQREEAAKAAQLKAEIKEEQLRLLEEEKLKAKKKTTKKKKKKTKAKSSA